MATASPTPAPEIDGIAYHTKPAKNPNTPVFCALHDTGGDEHSMDEIVAAIDTNAGLISPRGPVSENGQNRFFRPPQGEEYDQHDIATNAKAIVQFVNEATKRHHIDRRDLIWLGYASGANLITSIMLLHPEVIQKAILFRPMTVLTPPQIPTLPEANVFMASGRLDPIVGEDQTQRLIHLLQQTGAIVELFLHDGGHHLDEADLVAAGTWYQKQTGVTPEPAQASLATAAAAEETNESDEDLDHADSTGDEADDLSDAHEAGTDDLSDAHEAEELADVHQTESDDLADAHQTQTEADTETPVAASAEPAEVTPQEENTDTDEDTPTSDSDAGTKTHESTSEANKTTTSPPEEDRTEERDKTVNHDDRTADQTDDDDDDDDDFTIPRIGRR